MTSHKLDLRALPPEEPDSVYTRGQRISAGLAMFASWALVVVVANFNGLV